MALDFQPRSESSFDQDSGVVITRPRSFPVSLPSGQQGVEYQYMFHRGDERVGGLGVLGTDRIFETAAGRERVFTLDLGHGAVLESVLSFKESLGGTDDAFAFLRSLARGLVMAYAGLMHNNYNLRYLAATNVAVLARLGVVVPGDVEVGAEGGVWLAEVFIPAYRP